MLAFMRKVVLRRNANDCLEKGSHASFALVILLMTSLITLLYYIGLDFLSNFIGIVSNHELLVTVSFVIDVVLLYKVTMNDIARTFSEAEVSDIAVYGKIRKYFKKILLVFRDTMISQTMFLTPFYVAYGIFTRVTPVFFVNCVLVLIALGIIIALWSLVIYGTISMIKRYWKKMSKTHEAVLFVLFITISIFVIMNYKGVSIDAILVNIIDMFRQVALAVQTYAVSINSNILLLINICMMLMLVQGVVILLHWLINVLIYTLERVEEKKYNVYTKSVRRYRNHILRSCLARSPTAI